MVKSITPLITTVALLGASFLILSIPTWMSAVVFISLAASVGLHWIVKRRFHIKIVWNFLTEFCGFCWLVLLFVSMVILMNQTLSY